jgi:hypothetical protein
VVRCLFRPLSGGILFLLMRRTDTSSRTKPPFIVLLWFHCLTSEEIISTTVCLLKLEYIHFVSIPSY